MARHPAPLPDPFPGKSFSTATARAHGISRARTRAQDLVRPHHGVRSPAGLLTFEHECAALHTRLPASAVFSHVTAARLHGLPLPLRLQRAEVFDVMVPRGIRAPRGKKVRGHQAMVDPKDTGTRTRLPATTPERTFCDLASMLTLGELVAVGDAMVRRAGPRAHAALRRAVARHPARRHRRRLLRAFELIDPRAESPKESEVRVLIIESGFPAPAVNHVVLDASGAFVARVDLAYPASKIAIEYDGDHHRDPGQWRKDQQRRRRLEALGWSVLNVTQADLDDPQNLLADLRAAIARRH